jgi:hypothetical protein
VRVIIEIQNNLQRDDGQGSRAVCQHKGLAEGCSHVEKRQMHSLALKFGLMPN